MRLAIALAAALSAPLAYAQDAAVAPADAALADAAAADAPDVAPAPACTPEPLPADRAPQVTVTIGPEQPRVGDRVVITYRFR